MLWGISRRIRHTFYTFYPERICSWLRNQKSEHQGCCTEWRSDTCKFKQILRELADRQEGLQGGRSGSWKLEQDWTCWNGGTHCLFHFSCSWSISSADTVGNFQGLYTSSPLTPSWTCPGTGPVLRCPPRKDSGPSPGGLYSSISTFVWLINLLHKDAKSNRRNSFMFTITSV